MFINRNQITYIIPILKYIDFSQSVPSDVEPIVATVGFFDGVHVGHRYLIEQVMDEALNERLPSAVITFPVHPRKVLEKEYQPALLCGFDEKVEQLRTTRVDYCISYPFTKELSQLTAKQFMENVLKDKLNVRALLVGHDHRFGRHREESFQQYKEYGEEIGIKVIQAKEFKWFNEDVSSSRIRRLLKAGEIMKTNSLLSYPYTISGKIVEGYQVGRTIGFPTANMQIWERFKVVPALGVYAVYVHMKDETREGMLYIGKRPTLHHDENISIEVNIFDFDGDLYNQSLTVEFVDFIRPDIKFDSLNVLVQQIHQDKDDVKKRLKELEI